MRRKTMFRIVIPVIAVIAVVIGVLLAGANRILKYELERFLGKGFSVGSIDLSWGGVTAENVSLKRPDAKEAFGAESIRVRADFLGLLTRKNTIARLALRKPHLFLEIARNGDVVFPIPGGDDKKKSRDGKQKDPAAKPYLVKNLEIDKAAIEYLDRKAGARPALIRFTDTDLDMEDLSAPISDVMSTYRLSSTVLGKNGNGNLKANGTLNLQTKDTKTKLKIRGLDITELKPYYQKTGDVDIKRGFLSVDSDITVVKSRINATGTMVIRDLEFSSNTGTFLGLPLAAVTGLLKNNNNEITLDFTIEGDLKNPKFNVSESLVKNVTLSLAKSLGLPIQDIGKSVFDLGGSALKSLFK